MTRRRDYALARVGDDDEDDDSAQALRKRAQ